MSLDIAATSSKSKNNSIYMPEIFPADPHRPSMVQDSNLTVLPLQRSASLKKVRFSIGGIPDPTSSMSSSSELESVVTPLKSKAHSSQSEPELPCHSNESAVHLFVAAAITKKIKGDKALYYSLVDLLSKRPQSEGALSPTEMCLYLRSLTLNVSRLSSGFQELIMAVLAIQWLGQENSFVHIYSQFLENLVSAHAVYVTPVAKTLVQHLGTALKVYSKSLPSILFERIHTSLERILHLVPTGPSFLLPILTVNFPHKSQDIESQIFYVKSLLRITEYASVLRNQILSVIVEGIVQVDVAIQIEIEELDEEELDAIQDTVFSMDDLDVSASNKAEPSQSSDVPDEDAVDPSGYESDESSNYEETSLVVADIKGMIEKLDALLYLLFQYVSEINSKGHLENPGNTNGEIVSIFYASLDIFDRVVIPTHRLRCTQFLVFYMGSLNKAFPNDIMGLLVSRLFAIDSPSVIRISAAAYLGSYIARAKYVEISSVRTCLCLLNQFSQSYLDSNEATMGSRINVERFGVLYSAVQAILYVFCFRWKDLMLDSEAPLHGQLPIELKDFQRVLLSRFAPLKVCSEPIVQEFSKIMYSLDIMYCFPLIGSNPSLGSLSQSSAPEMVRNTSQSSISSLSMDILHMSVERLDSFFPFDPMTLPRSRNFVTPLYQEWVSSDDAVSDLDDDDLIIAKDFELDSDDDERVDIDDGVLRSVDDMSTSVG
ncbi:hypothetical protein BASA83_006486 [Batrachochytrium salamandrivorans]|nr:hypothetical protein BASA83_006486 [Batrachochytrium salamandrivorans]